MSGQRFRFGMRHGGIGAFDTSRVSCADLTPYQQSQDPRCGGGSAGPAVYVAPAPIATPACAFGPTMFTQECQTQVDAVEQQRLAAADAANRKVFVDNCNRDWQANATRYAELKMAVPPNDCAYRGYGQTNLGPGYLPGTPTEVLDWRAANPGGGVSIPWDQESAEAAKRMSGSGGPFLFAFTNQTSGDNSNFHVGDKWQIHISGAALNAPVSMNGAKNGTNTPLAQFGSTDSSGSFTLAGTMSAGEVGSWQEAWRVADQIVASISFTVSPGSSTPAGGKLTTQQTNTPGKTAAGGSTQTTGRGAADSIGEGSNTWLWVAGIAAVGLLVWGMSR